MFGIRTRARAAIATWMRETIAQTPLIGGGDGTPGFRASDRVSIAPNTSLVDAILNVNGGSITIGEYVSFGNGVSILTGRHDPALRGLDRMVQVPRVGNDIVIETGAWLASNVTVLGPCRIGAHAVVAAGAVVTKDVQPGEIVAGVPARHLGWA